MSSYGNFSWRKGTKPGQPDVVADSATTHSDDGLRAASGRNYKVRLGGGRYEAVRAWNLKEKRDGKWVIVHAQRDRAEAEKWVGKPVE